MPENTHRNSSTFLGSSPSNSEYQYEDVWYQSVDGLRLYARDYNHAGKERPTILCMHGLTRNSQDFQEICQLLAGRYRLIVVDQRGRGRSEYDPNPDNYNPLTYVQDMFLLLEGLEVSSVTLMGTSMGGLMSLMMTASKPDLVHGLIINDIGPEVSKAGLDRLKSYVGRSAPVSNWQEAVSQTKDIAGVAFPKFTEPQWEKFARQLFWEDEKGCPYLPYDPAISTSLSEDKVPEQSAAPDLWPLFKLISDKPMLLIRGELSDILERECVEEMHQIKHDLISVEVPDVGHAPLLNESEAQSAIEEFLTSLG